MRDSILSVASTRFCRSASAKKIHYKNVKKRSRTSGEPLLSKLVLCCQNLVINTRFVLVSIHM